MIVDQTEFADAVLDADQTVPLGLLDPHGRPAGKRFDVYRNNVVASLIDAMQIAFPVVHKLVGERFFKAVAGIYVRAHPPKSPLLMFYGADFPKFLEDLEQARKLPYLADVARLELLRRLSYHSADVPAVVPEALAKLPADDLLGARFILSPSTHIIASDHPVLSIWTMHITENGLEPEITGQNVLITRPELDVEMVHLDIPTHAFLSRLIDGSMGQAYDAALECDETFDLSQALGLMLSHNMITEIVP